MIDFTIYGTSPEQVAAKMQIDPEEVDRIREAFFARYPKIQETLDTSDE